MGNMENMKLGQIDEDGNITTWDTCCDSCRIIESIYDSAKQHIERMKKNGIAPNVLIVSDKMRQELCVKSECCRKGADIE